MARTARIVLTLTFITATWRMPFAFAQEPSVLPMPQASAPGMANTAPVAPPPEEGLRPLPLAPLTPGPYFQTDPLLDRPPLPQPGLFADVDVELLDVHIKNRLFGSDQLSGANTVDTVHVPGAPLDWTVSPRFELGYNLPSGFGAFSLVYRFLATNGNTTLAGPDGPETVASRMDLNQGDFDYTSSETSLWPHCDMKWRVGLRLANLYFDSRADEAFAQAAAGTGIFESYTTNHFLGVGPHAGLELARRWEALRLACFTRVDFGTLLGRLHQRFVEQSTSLGSAETLDSGSQAVPIVNIQAGLRWQPLANQDAEWFLGYVYEHWWSVGKLGDSSAEVADQGIVLRLRVGF